jgi:DNA modification methylase
MTISLNQIEANNKRLERRFSKQLEINHDLKRTLVSFQANKREPSYRWYKFKEGYSSALVSYVLEKMNAKSGKLIDPFAGSGTSLFASSENGLNSVGIELLPFGIEIMEVRRIIANGERARIRSTIRNWIKQHPWNISAKEKELVFFNITKDAYPPETKKSIAKYLASIENEDENTRRILRFSLLCILEEISYTRKDGQYLRWDYRSGRRQGAKIFDKGIIRSFDDAIINKLENIFDDLGHKKDTIFDTNEASRRGDIDILQGSCLSVLPTLRKNSFDILMTSPPYCNRYDYTRTYALELALFIETEEQLKSLRQELMSCTVENREKKDLDKHFSRDLLERATQAFYEQKELQDILEYLDEKRANKELNNNGIVRMVRNYFYELSLIIFECARVLKRNAPFVMVNDNVRYAGAIIPVDLILSDIAEKAGFSVEKIWILPVGKGNSSQQMGIHGREELRKCVYIWRKNDK